jgi:sulfur carrier protein ThiS
LLNNEQVEVNKQTTIYDYLEGVSWK